MATKPKVATPGMRTSEFYLTAIGIIAVALLAVFSDLDATAAVAAITGLIATYNVSRGIAKKGQSTDVGGET